MVGLRTYPVFQCDDCVHQVQFGDGTFESAVTFALDERGRRFDPADPPPELN